MQQSRGLRTRILAALVAVGTGLGMQLPAAGAAPAPTPPAPAPAVAADPVVGIPQPCAPQHPWPAGASPAEVRRQLAANTGIRLTGGQWDQPRNAPMVRIVWETLEAVSCTDYLQTITRANPRFTINAAPISGWAFGDWGLTRPGALTLDLAKWHEPYRAGDRGRLVRLTVHELGHAYSHTPQARRAYQRFETLYARTGQFSNYGHGSANENFSEVLGYYVARCAAGNPYDAAAGGKGRFDAYYALARDEVFGGHEFGPAAGRTPDCSRSRTAAQPVTRVLKEGLDR